MLIQICNSLALTSDSTVFFHSKFFLEIYEWRNSLGKWTGGLGILLLHTVVITFVLIRFYFHSWLSGSQHEFCCVTDEDISPGSLAV